MQQLPADFIAQTREVMGDERFERYLKSFEEEPPVSIRLNPKKGLAVSGKRLEAVDGERVPWCRDGYYLKKRPNFTMDPLLHAGCYYVQEAASMFLDEVLRQQIVNSKLSNSKCLDLCAAPGGKSTLLRAALPEDCVLYSNEPVRQRANILAENVEKWGWPNHIVTNAYPKDYRASKLRFDVILCDVPCSGEGMFRKDPATIREWSPQNVEKCWRLQRDIVADIWPCLNDGGILIYSTCTFNTKENEENVRWLLSEYDAEVLPVDIKPEWNITGSLLDGFTEPVYRFIPGITRSEGLFMAVLRKGRTASPTPPQVGRGEASPYPPPSRGGSKKCQTIAQVITPLSTQRGVGGESAENKVELTYQQAIAYLRGEALRLPDDMPRGEVTVCFLGHPLGLVKNIGTRANNLYPKAWRIKTTHIPSAYEPVLDEQISQ